MRIMKLHLFGLFAIIAVSACVDLPFGQAGLQTTELPPDIIIVQNVNTIPNPPINTNDQFSISFEIKNQDDVNEISDVDVDLFDYGLCKPLTDSFTPGGWAQTGDVYSNEIGSFAPGQTEFIEWIFQAPTNEQIGRLQTTCPVRFRTTYEFSATSLVNVQVITSDRLQQLQRAGETPTFTPTQTLGRGPIKISFNFGAALPIRASREGQLESILPVFVTVEDKGQGLFGDIQSNVLFLKVPSAFRKLDTCTKFTEVTTNGRNGGGNGKDHVDITGAALAESGFKIYTNTEKITMIKRKSTQLRCSFVVPDESEVIVDKTYFLSANMSYVYSLTNDVNIGVKPTLTV